MSGHSNASIRLLDVRKFRERVDRYHDQKVFAVAFSPDGQTLFIVDRRLERYTIHVMDTESGEAYGFVHVPPMVTDDPYAVRPEILVNENRLILVAAGQPAQLAIWKLTAANQEP